MHPLHSKPRAVSGCMPVEALVLCGLDVLRGASAGQQCCLVCALTTDISNGTFWRWSLHLRPHPQPFINMPFRLSNTSIHLVLLLLLLLALSPFLALYEAHPLDVCVV